MNEGIEDDPQQWQLRVLNGPARGATLPLRERLDIGRGSSSDLQLLDGAVSRWHARIVTDEDGRHVVVDLDSRNGTILDGRRVGRHRLEMNSVIEIGQTPLIYEPRLTRASDPTRATARALFVVDGNDPRTRQGTQLTPAVGNDAPDPARPRFEAPDGTCYPGALVDDIVEYRCLRSKTLRGGLADPTVSERFAALGAGLVAQQAKPALSRRAAIRFSCSLTAEIRFASGDVLPCRIEDLGADGVRLCAPNHRIPPNSIVWLAVDTEPNEAQHVVFAGRVVWSHTDQLGLAFSGAPRSDNGRYDMTDGVVQREVLSSHEDTHPISLARVEPVAKSFQR